MSTTAEKQLWQWLKSAENAELPYALHWQRIENRVKKNTPDVEGCYAGRAFTIELKSINKVYELRKKLTAGQAMFLYSRWRAGGRSWILIEVQGQRRYLIPGNKAIDLLYVKTEKELGLYRVLNPTARPIHVLEMVAFANADV